jgi:hypothetical protein
MQPGPPQAVSEHGSALTKLRWILRRLRAMGPREVAWRTRQAMLGRLERSGIARCRPRVPSGETGAPWVANLPTGIDPQPYRIAADRVLAGQFDVFALRNVQLGFPPDWNVDPKTGTRAPAVFGKAIDYRNEQCVGDVKYLWR